MRESGVLGTTLGQAALLLYIGFGLLPASVVTLTRMGARRRGAPEAVRSAVGGMVPPRALRCRSVGLLSTEWGFIFLLATSVPADVLSTVDKGKARRVQQYIDKEVLAIGIFCRL